MNSIEPLTTRVAAYWSSRLGCEVAALQAPGVTLVGHAPALQRYRGAFMLRMGEAVVASVPHPYLEAVGAAARGADGIFSVAFARHTFGTAVEAVEGPSWLGYVDAEAFRPPDSGTIRQLSERDVVPLWQLADACNATDWENSGISFEGTIGFGSFDGDTLVAASMLDRRGDGLMEVGVLTHPAHRGRGYARAVVSAAIRLGLQQCPLLQYRTLESNRASVGMARGLGFQQCASSIAVRLADAAPS